MYIPFYNVTTCILMSFYNMYIPFYNVTFCILMSLYTIYVLSWNGSYTSNRSLIPNFIIIYIQLIYLFFCILSKHVRENKRNRDAKPAKRTQPNRARGHTCTEWFRGITTSMATTYRLWTINNPTVQRSRKQYRVPHGGDLSVQM